MKILWKLKPALFILSVIVLVMIVATPNMGKAMSIFEKIIFSDKGYAHKILHEEKVLGLNALLKEIGGRDDFPQVSSTILGYDIERSFLLVRLKNTGNFTAWGVAECSVEGREGQDILFSVPSLRGNMSEWAFYVIEIDPPILPSTSVLVRVNFSWKELYKK